ncbi:hypothetical protein BKA69DRAFT_1025746 [Paraphysoderma sedebokerense]|nr:hypothetical protein BKA69DRAFT_1026112 [Paraphysoderma sedebokerense]KAI9144401.1 hypothetical protein BKA69DRAFT_1025746 [Paraphysoderma sedebokerense]
MGQSSNQEDPQKFKVDREAYKALIQAALGQRERLKAVNLSLQNRLGDYFRRKRTDDKPNEVDKAPTDQQQRYLSVITQLKDMRAEQDRFEESNKGIIDELRVKLEEKKVEANLKSEEFRKYKHNVAVNAGNSRTGKPIPSKIIEQMENYDLRKEQEVMQMRLENIKLRNRIRRSELLLRQKEELAEGLHLIDFEQLKIENQTYNEKIEERNEELLKLRKKITNIVQVLTHIKEKLQFVQVILYCSISAATPYYTHIAIALFTKLLFI